MKKGFLKNYLNMVGGLAYLYDSMFRSQAGVLTALHRPSILGVLTLALGSNLIHVD
jgi:hypothetical protein